MASAVEVSSGARRLGSIEGLDGKKNHIIYHLPQDQAATGTVVFFGGDIQDYRENMLVHRDNKHYVQWNLEDTAVMLHQRFPTWEIVVVRPAKMSLLTFSCYENFVEVNNFGAPTHKATTESIHHLKSILQNIELITQKQNNMCKDAASIRDSENSPLMLIGFSKGCVVLNQLLYAFHALNEGLNEELLQFVKRIKTIYWLEGGHSGTSNTWITDKTILENFSKLNIKVQIHVTPYQVLCDTRPRIGKEEKIFHGTLRRLGVDVLRTLHFENESRSLDLHFRVLEVFSSTM